MIVAVQMEITRLCVDHMVQYHTVQCDTVHIVVDHRRVDAMQYCIEGRNGSITGLSTSHLVSLVHGICEFQACLRRKTLYAPVGIVDHGRMNFLVSQAPAL